MFDAPSKNSTPLRNKTIALPYASIKSYSRLISPVPVFNKRTHAFARPSDNVPRIVSRFAKEIESTLHYPSISSTQMRRWNEMRASTNEKNEGWPEGGRRKISRIEKLMESTGVSIDWRVPCTYTRARCALAWDTEAKRASASERASERIGISRTKTDRKGHRGRLGRLVL